MDLTTVVGLILGLGMVLVPFLNRFEVQSMPLALFFVFGGTLGATILSLPVVACTVNGQGPACCPFGLKA